MFEWIAIGLLVVMLFSACRFVEQQSKQINDLKLKIVSMNMEHRCTKNELKESLNKVTEESRELSDSLSMVVCKSRNETLAEVSAICQSMNALHGRLESLFASLYSKKL